MPAATAETTSVLIYDGDCGFCTSTANWFAQRIGSPEQIVPWQSTDLGALALSEADVTTAAYWVDKDGGTHRGHLGVARALEAAGLPWNLFGFAIRTPPVSWVAAVVYGLIAKNRYRLPGSTDACKLQL